MMIIIVMMMIMMLLILIMMIPRLVKRMMVMVVQELFLKLLGFVPLDTYHKGKKESVKNERATPVEDLNNDEVCSQTDDHDNDDNDANSQSTPLLPPSVFEHLKASSVTEKIPSQDVKGLLLTLVLCASYSHSTLFDLDIS